MRFTERKAEVVVIRIGIMERCSDKEARSIVMSLSVCLSVRDHIFVTTRPSFTKFFCTLKMAVARSSSGGVGIITAKQVVGDSQ